MLYLQLGRGSRTIVSMQLKLSILTSRKVLASMIVVGQVTVALSYRREVMLSAMIHCNSPSLAAISAASSDVIAGSAITIRI